MDAFGLGEFFLAALAILAGGGLAIVGVVALLLWGWRQNDRYFASAPRPDWDDGPVVKVHGYRRGVEGTYDPRDIEVAAIARGNRPHEW